MKTERFTLLIILLFIRGFAFSQIAENFSDGDFYNSPHWEGNYNSFIINPDHVLQLDAAESGRAALWIPTTFIGDEMEWKMSVKMDCNPSANNFVRIYLLSDSANLSAAPKRAFFLQFGENQSNDAIELFFEDKNRLISICRGTNGLIANPFEMNIKVIRNRNYEWAIWVDEHLMGDYRLDAQGVCDSMVSNVAFGIFCQFTSTNKNKYFFDNFYFGNPLVDSEAPQIERILPGDNYNQVKVIFNENVTRESALNKENYKILSWSESPVSCDFIIPHYNQVVLTFSSSFTPRINYQLQVSNIEDYSGNRLISATSQVIFNLLERNSLVISEIMADPFPSVGLLQTEYVELFNCRDSSFIISGWKLQIGNIIRDIPEFSIAGQGFVVLIPAAANVSFSDSVTIVPISLLNITDAGQLLILYNEFGEIIHHVHFRKEWHDNSYKSNGGWSLEMIDPYNPCSGKNNWLSSVHENGGTPGFSNSVMRENPDLTIPEILRIVVLDSLTIKLIFSETILRNQNYHQNLFTIDHHLQVESVEEVPPYNTTFIVRLSQALQPNIIYTLRVSDTIYDCVGLRVLIGESFIFGLPQQVEKNDLVINEVLSNPYGNEDADFIEIYNKSEKIIALSQIRVGSGGTDIPDKSILISKEGFDLFPNQYIALCKNPILTEVSYICPYSERLLLCDSLPNFPNDHGIVHLTNLRFQSIDKFEYDKSMHYALLQNLDGISLERLDIHLETQNTNNWKSAAEHAGFATPGYQNSQYIAITESDEFTIIPKVFSPDNDGFDDFTRICYNFPTSENRVLLQIFTKEGTLIRTIENNSISSLNECYVWDGVTDDQFLAPPDLYVVRMQYWNANGKTKCIKGAVGVIFRK